MTILAVKSRKQWADDKFTSHVFWPLVWVWAGDWVEKESFLSRPVVFSSGQSGTFIVKFCPRLQYPTEAYLS